MNYDFLYEKWDPLIRRIEKLEKVSDGVEAISVKVSDIQNSLKQIESKIGVLSSPHFVDGLNTVLDTIRIMQDTHGVHTKNKQ